MNAASMSSKRLKRVSQALESGRELSTRALMVRANCCAVSACVAELRANGQTIVCTRRMVGGRPLWFYRRVV